MHHPAFRHVPALPSGAGRAQAEIHLLVVQEVVLAHQADLGQHLAPHHEAGAADPADALWRIAGRLHIGKASQDTAGRTEADFAFELAKRIGKPERARLHGSVRIFQPAAGDAGARIGIHEVHQRPRGPGPHIRVRVQQQRIVRRLAAGAKMLDSPVVGIGETAIHRKG